MLLAAFLAEVARAFQREQAVFHRRLLDRRFLLLFEVHTNAKKPGIRYTARDSRVGERYRARGERSPV